MLLLPLAVLLTLPAAEEDGRLAVRRPADELRPGALLAGQLLGQHAPARAVGLDDDGAHGPDVDVAPAGQVGAELGVADEEVGQGFAPVGGRQGAGRADCNRRGPEPEEVAPRNDRESYLVHWPGSLHVTSLRESDAESGSVLRELLPKAILHRLLMQ